MKLLIASLVLCLSGCSTVVPVAAKFPAGPGRQALVACPNLQKLKDEAVKKSLEEEERKKAEEALKIPVIEEIKPS